MDPRFPTAQFIARQHMGPVGYHLIDIHIGLGTGTGLPDFQRKMAVQISGNNFIADPDDQISFLPG